MKHIKKLSIKKAVEEETPPEDIFDLLVSALTDGKKGLQPVT